jgi:hypothetical protein
LVWLESKIIRAVTEGYFEEELETRRWLTSKAYEDGEAAAYLYIPFLTMFPRKWIYSGDNEHQLLEQNSVWARVVNYSQPIDIEAMDSSRKY